VDTSETAELIDLDDLSNSLAHVHKQMIDIDKKINSFCDELGIKPPNLGSNV
jgi:hypothetical protein